MTFEQTPNDPREMRPRFQFSLRGLIGLSVACCLFFSAVAWAWSIAATWVWIIGAILFGCVSGGLFLVGIYRKRPGLAAGGALLWVAAAFVWPALAPTRESGGGLRSVRVAVTVIDADTKAPIAGATVRAYGDGPYVYSASKPPGFDTGTEGEVELEFQIHHDYGSVRTPFRGTEKWSSLIFGSSAIEAEALGYRDVHATLSELVGAETWQEDRLPLPGVTIEMVQE